MVVFLKVLFEWCLLFVPFRFHFSFFFSSLRNMPNKQNPFSPELWEILFRKVVCLFGGQRKDENYRGCYYSVNPLGKIGEDCLKKKKKTMVS